MFIFWMFICFFIRNIYIFSQDKLIKQFKKFLKLNLKFFFWSYKLYHIEDIIDCTISYEHFIAFAFINNSSYPMSMHWRFIKWCITKLFFIMYFGSDEVLVAKQLPKTATFVIIGFSRSVIHGFIHFTVIILSHVIAVFTYSSLSNLATNSVY